MKIINLLKGTKPGVSCELFPPKQGSQLANALEIVDTIAQQKPSFISVTYGAGGSNAGEAVAVAAEVHNCGVPSMAHLTCINADEQRIETVLGQLRDKGIVSHVGITDLQPENLQWVVEHVPAGTVESILCFCHYCLNDDLMTEYFDWFEERGIGIINASPLSMGLLSSRGVPDWHPADRRLVEACARAAAHCAAKGYPIEKLAVQYSISNPRIATTLFSSANPDNVRKNIAVAEEAPDEGLIKEVREIIGDQLRVRWKNS